MFNTISKHKKIASHSVKVVSKNERYNEKGGG